MFVLVASLCCAVLAVTSAQVTAPIPLLASNPGYRLDPASVGAPVQLEAFLELNCGDSAYSWPILQQLQANYGPENLEIIIHMLTLPYHRQAWLTTQGFYQVEDVAPENVVAYVDIMFENLGALSGGATVEMSELEVQALIGDIQEEATGIPSGDFASSIGSYGSQAVRAWKYATRRGNAGTPWFWINNVDTAVNPSIRISYDEWVATLDPLMPSKKVAIKQIEPMPHPIKSQATANEIAVHQQIAQAKNLVAKRLKAALNLKKKGHH